MLPYIKCNFCKWWDERFKNFLGKTMLSTFRMFGTLACSIIYGQMCSSVSFLSVWFSPSCQEMGSLMLLAHMPTDCHVKGHDTSFCLVFPISPWWPLTVAHRSASAGRVGPCSYSNRAQRKIVLASFGSLSSCAISMGPLGISGVVWGLILLQDTWVIFCLTCTQYLLSRVPWTAHLFSLFLTPLTLCEHTDLCIIPCRRVWAHVHHFCA